MPKPQSGTNAASLSQAIVVPTEEIYQSLFEPLADPITRTASGIAVFLDDHFLARVAGQVGKGRAAQSIGQLDLLGAAIEIDLDMFWHGANSHGVALPWLGDIGLNDLLQVRHRESAGFRVSVEKVHRKKSSRPHTAI